jgi:hypothetical protein
MMATLICLPPRAFSCRRRFAIRSGNFRGARARLHGTNARRFHRAAAGELTRIFVERSAKKNSSPGQNTGTGVIGLMAVVVDSTTFDTSNPKSFASSTQENLRGLGAGE